jgi:hypothetical protein
MSNRRFIFAMGKGVFLVIGLSVTSIHASIDSGGGKGSVGPLISHSSLGAPFASSSVTAGGIDLLYPLQNEQPTPPPEKPSGGPSGGGGGGGGGGGPAPAAKKAKTGMGISKKNSSSNKKSLATKAQNKKSTSQSKKKSKKK